MSDLGNRLEQMFGISEAAASRTREVDRLQGILNEIASVLAKVFGDDVHRVPQDQLPNFVLQLTHDPKTHICLEDHWRQERDHALRLLDAKDHELAALKDRS